MQTYGSNPYTLSDDNTLYPNPSNAEAFFYGSSEIPSKIVFLHDKTGHIISATLHKSRIYIYYFIFIKIIFL
jgi:hypothetical protein